MLTERKYSLYYHPKIYPWLFFAGLLLMAFLYNYHEILQMPPASIHCWRQSDCLSLTLNYFHGDMNFLKPAMHNLQSDGNQSGLTAGEFPLLYYAVALLWKVFGEHYWVYRSVVIIIAFTGFFSLYKLTEAVLKDSVWALMLSFLFFTSPIVVFYSNNFLTNIPGLSFSITGTWLFYRFVANRKTRALWFSMLFFALAGLMKASSLMLYLMVVFVFFSEWTGMIRYRKEGRIFNKPLKQVFPLLTVIVAVLAWYVYAYYFNKTHQGKYTFNDLWPIWDLSYEQILLKWNGFLRFVIYQFQNIYILIFSGAALVFVIIMTFIRRFPVSLLILLFVFLLGNLTYFLFWYQAFDVHDYYMIDLLPIISVFILAFLYGLKENWFRVFNNIIIRIVFFSLLIYSMLYADNNIETRMFYGNRSEASLKIYMTGLEVGTWWFINDYYNNYQRPYAEIQPYNRFLGIKKDDKVVVLNDGSINISLALMDQKGWNEFGPPFIPPAMRINYFKALGASYLFVSDPKYFAIEELRPFFQKKIGQYKGISIFDIRDS